MSYHSGMPFSEQVKVIKANVEEMKKMKEHEENCANPCPEKIQAAWSNVLYWQVELALVEISKAIYDRELKEEIEARWLALAELQQINEVQCLYSGSKTMIFERSKAMGIYESFGHPTDDAYFRDQCGNPSNGHIEEVAMNIQLCIEASN